MAGPIKIAILANAKPALQGIKQVESSAGGMGKKLGGIGSSIKGSFAAIGGAMAAAGAVEGFKQVIDQAASLSAAVGATKQVFGEAAGGMLDWSKSAATSLGLSQSEALNATKVFGGFFTAVGMGNKEAAAMSQSWATMAGNLAAFGDMPTSDAIDAITSALQGQLDPLQRYIPTITGAAIEQKAMALSGKANAKSLTAQDKAAAINALMMDSVANKAGAAERAQGGYAVQMDVLKAQMKDAAAVIGGFFLPAITAGMSFINKTAIPAVKDLAGKYGPKLKSFFSSIGGFKPPKALVDVAQSQQVQSIFTNLKNGVLSLGPMFSKVIGVIGPILAQVGSTLSGAFSKALPQIKAIFGTIGTIISQWFEYARTIISVALAIITMLWQKFGANILAFISAAFSGVVRVIQGALNIVKGVFDLIIGLLTGDWSRAWDGVKSIVSGAWQVISGIFGLMKAGVTLLGQFIKGALSLAWSAIKAAAGVAWNAIKAVLVAAWNGIKAAVSAAVSAVGAFVAAGWAAVKNATVAAWNAVKSATAAVWNGLKSIVSGAISAISGAVSAGLAAVKSAVAAGWNAVKSATSAAWSAIKSAVSTGLSNVVATVKSLPGKVQSAVSNAATWLINAGKNMIEGLISGIKQMASRAVSAAKQVVLDAISAAWDAINPGSPSKETTPMGVSLGQGIAYGLDISKETVEKAISGLVKAVTTAFPVAIKKTFPKGTKASVIEKWKKAEAAAAKKRATIRDTLTKQINAENARIAKVIDARDAIAEKLSAANDHLAELQEARAGVVTSIAGAFENSFRLINDASEEGIASIDDILQRSRDAVAQAQEFAGHLKSLATKGVSSEVLQELAQAGPKAGLDTARALMAGTADQIKELNANYKTIAASGQQAGDVVAGTMYDTGIAAARAVAEGFASQQAALENRILSMINALTAKINAAIAAATPKKPVKVKAAVTTVAVTKATAAKAAAAAKPVAKKAVPVTTAPAPVMVTVNTGAIVDKRGLVDVISDAFQTVSAALGRPITMNVK